MLPAQKKFVLLFVLKISIYLKTYPKWITTGEQHFELPLPALVLWATT